MQKKRIRKKKRYANKPGAMQWGWMLAGGAVIISCLLLVAIAIGNRASAIDATIKSPVTGTNAANPISSETSNTFGTANAQPMTGVFLAFCGWANSCAGKCAPSHEYSAYGCR